MAAENLTVTISTDSTQAELAMLKARLATVDLAMYGELVRAYRAAAKTVSDDQFEAVAARFLTALDMYALFTGRSGGDISRELNRELG